MENEGSTNKFNINFQNKTLIIVLSIFAVVIIGLIIGIIVASSSSSENNQNNNNDETSESSSSSSNDNKKDEGIPEGMSVEDFATDQQLTELYQHTQEEAERIASIEPVDVAAIDSLYQNGINECFEKNKPDYAVIFIYSRTELLVNKGLKQEALNILLGMDWDMMKNRLHGAELYRHYSKVIELAEELGDTATADKFKKLRADVEDEYRADYEGTKKYVDSLNNQGSEQ